MRFKNTLYINFVLRWSCYFN